MGALVSRTKAKTTTSLALWWEIVAAYGGGRAAAGAGGGGAAAGGGRDEGFRRLSVDLQVRGVGAASSFIFLASLRS